MPLDLRALPVRDGGLRQRTPEVDVAWHRNGHANVLWFPAHHILTDQPVSGSLELEGYCRRKLVEWPEWAPGELFYKVRASVTARIVWDFSTNEVNWMLAQLSVRMGWRP